ncbi:hypothetical protein [Sulfitobacter brevis]|uniref:hypothetical protein n=1 Tax=Sulfitobacter brevis TaxID=74348 RepID=UPI000A6025AA|nr:hypothetical protein [Sulfitobacter brevis]
MAKRPARITWRQRLNRFLAWVRLRVPFGLRLLLGIVLICGGLLGFLPILGFWMIPLGIAVAALDIKPMLRRWRNRHRE